MVTSGACRGYRRAIGGICGWEFTRVCRYVCLMSCQYTPYLSYHIHALPIHALSALPTLPFLNPFLPYVNIFTLTLFTYLTLAHASFPSHCELLLPLSLDGCVSSDSSYLIGVGYGGSLHLWSAKATEGGSGSGSGSGSGVGGSISQDIITTTTSSTIATTTVNEGRRYGIHSVVDVSDVVGRGGEMEVKGVQDNSGVWSESEHWSPVPFVTGQN